MSQSNSKPQLALPYLAKTDGRSSKFPKGTKVIVLWRGTTDYGETVRVVDEEEFLKCFRTKTGPYRALSSTPRQNKRCLDDWTGNRTANH